jgi:hypothetical protein
VAGGGGDQRRTGVPRGGAQWESLRRRPGGRQRQPDREAVCAPSQAGCCRLQRPQPAQRFLTSAAESGASVFKMTEVSRHRSLDTLRGYVRQVDLFKEHAGAAFL